MTWGDLSTAPSQLRETTAKCAGGCRDTQSHLCLDEKYHAQTDARFGSGSQPAKNTNASSQPQGVGFPSTAALPTRRPPRPARRPVFPAPSGACPPQRTAREKRPLGLCTSVSWLRRRHRGRGSHRRRRRRGRRRRPQPRRRPGSQGRTARHGRRPWTRASRGTQMDL